MPDKTTTIAADQWLLADELAAQGFQPGGPEIDLGMRWGPNRTVRVSFAPHPDGPGGYLYAYDTARDRYLLLARHTTAERAHDAWAELTTRSDSPDGYLAFAALDYQERSLQPIHARQLLWHCLERELAAQRELGGALDERARFDVARAVVVARSARVSAEDLYVEALRGMRAEPVVVNYRILDRPDWTGRLPAADLSAAGTEVRQLIDVADEHRLTAQATSVRHGHTIVAAARVPELQFAVRIDRIPSNAAQLAI